MPATSGFIICSVQSGGIVPNAYDNLLNASQSMDRILPQFASVKSMCRPGQCYTYQNVLFFAD